MPRFKPCKGDPSECSCLSCIPPENDGPDPVRFAPTCDPLEDEDRDPEPPEPDYPDASEHWERQFHNL